MTIGVIRWDASERAQFGRGGIAALVAACVLVAAGWLRLVSDTRPAPTLLLIGFCAAGAATIVVLCVVTVPARLRLALSLALLVVMLLAMEKGDPMAAKRTIRAVEAAKDAADPTPGAAVAHSKPDGIGDGARVVLVPGGSGDGGWAGRLDAMLDRRLGGAQGGDYAVDGTVILIGAAVRIDWGIGSTGARVACGAITGSGDNATLGVVLAEPLRQAVARSIETGRPACP